MKTYMSIITALLLFISCNKTNLEGTWVENDNYSFPQILEFRTDSLFDYYRGFGDTSCYLIQDTLLITITKDDTTQAPFQLVGDSVLRIGYVEYKKSKAKWFFDDMMDGMPVGVDLPKVRGNRFEFFVENFLYFVGFKNNKVVIRHYEHTLSTGLDFISSIDAKRETCMEYRNQYIIFVDKNVPYYVINQIKNVFEYSRERIIYFAVNNPTNNKYQSLYTLRFKTQPVEKSSYEKFAKRIIAERDSINKVDTLYDDIIYCPPPYQELYFHPSVEQLTKLYKKGEASLVKIYKDSLVLNNSSVDKKRLFEQLKERIIKVEGKHITIYYVNDDAIYNDFINFYQTIVDVYYSILNTFSHDFYGQGFESLHDSIQNNIKRKFPQAIWEIRKKDLKDLQ